MWHRSVDLALEIYRLTETFPREERYGLVTQLRKAVVSIPSNIAEGQGRGSPGECRQFTGQARGSLFEVDAQLEVAIRLKLISADEGKALSREVEEIS